MVRRRLPLILFSVTFIVVAGYYFEYWRAAAALAMAYAVLWLGFSYFRAAGEVPAEADRDDVTASDLRYVCTVCGLELKVEIATTDRAPTHCRESMKLVNAAGSSPLRPV